MQVLVELYGIARARAGVPHITVTGSCLGDVLADLAHRVPALGETCIAGRNLRPGFMASVNGRCFVTAAETELTEGDRVLLLHLDAGG